MIALARGVHRGLRYINRIDSYDAHTSECIADTTATGAAAAATSTDGQFIACNENIHHVISAGPLRVALMTHHGRDGRAISPAAL